MRKVTKPTLKARVIDWTGLNEFLGSMQFQVFWIFGTSYNVQNLSLCLDKPRVIKQKSTFCRHTGVPGLSTYGNSVSLGSAVAIVQTFLRSLTTRLQWVLINLHGL